MPARHAIEMAEPVVTRSLPAGSGTVVSRSRFGAIDETGDVVLAWRDGGRWSGYTTGMIGLLARGGTVVAGAPSRCGADSVARSLWPDVVVVHIEPGTEKLRRALGPVAGGVRTAPRLAPETPRGRAPDILIQDLGDITAAVRALTIELERLCPKAAAVEKRPRTATARPSGPRRPGARSDLSNTPHRPTIERSPNAAVCTPAPQARAVSST